MPIYDTPISQSIWDMKYRLKALDGTAVDQSVDDTWRRVAKAIAAPEGAGPAPTTTLPGDTGENALDAADFWEDHFYEIMASGRFSPAGRIIAGAGAGRNVTLSNCFVMGTIPDSMAGIFEHLREAALTMQAGGGIGYDFSTLRPKGSPVVHVGADASGPLSFMDVWDAMCRTVMSAGSRRGAMMATMRVDHPDIVDFITAKQDKARLRMFNLSVMVTDEFMAAVERDGMFDLVHAKPPALGAATHGEMRHDRESGVTKFVHRTVRARELWDLITRSTYNAAEPGVIFIDRCNADDNLGYLGTIAATNPCGEKPMQPYDSCLLGSINLAMMIRNAFQGRAHLDSDTLRKTVETAIRFMDNVIEANFYPLDQQRNVAQRTRQLGLGVTGLADALVMLGMRYGSDEAVEWTRMVMREIAVAAYLASCDLAEERGSFPDFNGDEFLKAPRFASRLPENVQNRIREVGIRNGLLISIAPTGTISLFAGNVSSGIEPIFAPSYTRKVLQPDGSRIEETVEDYAVALWRKEAPAHLFDAMPPALVSVADLTVEDHVRMQAAAQEWVDSSISKTINVPEDFPFERFQEVYRLAYEMGCKGCTTYRPNEITGSILSAPAKADVPVEVLAERATAFLKAATPGSAANTKRVRAIKAWNESFGVEKVVQVPDGRRADYLALIEAFEKDEAVPTEIEMNGGLGHSLLTEEDQMAEAIRQDEATDAALDREVRANRLFAAAYGNPDLPERPEELVGTTYKLKFPGEAHAIYVTINDLVENFQRRPFEIFVNSKNPEHQAWIVALTRMISAVFRRPFDSRFVADELRQVFDPRGGGYVKGTYIPSIPAAIGGIIARHMDKIGDDNAWSAPDPDLSGPPIHEEGATVTPDGAVAMQAPEGDPAKLQEMRELTRVPLCPTCGSSNMKVEAGCKVCRDCGDSRCG